MLQRNSVESIALSGQESVTRRWLLWLIACSLLVMASLASADAPQHSPAEIDSLIEWTTREAPRYQLNEFDVNGDGLLEIEGIEAGDIIFRPHDGETQVEAGEYVVPNNLVYVDGDGDGTLDLEPRRVKLVVVIRDNLTYLFAENSDQLLGVFPNGTGRGGANTVASVRRINAVLGEQWGQEESQRLGFPLNAFGEITLGTNYFIHDEKTVTTAQEVHGTPDEWQFLLGTEVSGGCTRHRNRDIRTIRSHMQAGDLVMTVETPQDDAFDNALTLANLTNTAAKEPLLEVPTELLGANPNLLPLPTNMHPPSSSSPLKTSRWVTFDQLGEFPLPEVIAHPYTRGEYSVIPCGLETFYLSQIWSGRDPLIETPHGYQLNVAPTLRLPNGNSLETPSFYTPRTVTWNDVAGAQPRLSRGNRLQYFEFLMSDFAYQYAAWVATGAGERLNPADLQWRSLGQDIISMGPERHRQVQLVTGLIPIDYRWGPAGLPPQEPGDFLNTLKNRTLIHSLMNVFYGQPGQAYELDYRLNHPNGLAFPIRDQYLYQPSSDHEMIRTEEEALPIVPLLADALNSGRGAIFRVSQFATHTTPLRYELGLSQAHYYVLVPHHTDLEAGYVSVFDSMHPSELLQLPTEYLDDIFTTVTLTPLQTR